MSHPWRPARRMALHIILGLAMTTAICRNVEADTIRIDDVAEGVPIVTATTNPGAITIVSSGPQFVHFTFASTRFDTGPTDTAVRDLLESGGSVSDRIIITATNGSNNVDLVFGSDPVLPSVPPGVRILPSLPEDGTFQQVLLYFGGTATPVDTFLLRSAVPEPATLTLVSGVLGVLLHRAWSRTRSQRRRGEIRSQYQGTATNIAH